MATGSFILKRISSLIEIEQILLNNYTVRSIMELKKKIVDLQEQIEKLTTIINKTEKAESDSWKNYTAPYLPDLSVYLDTSDPDRDWYKHPDTSIE